MSTERDELVSELLALALREAIHALRGLAPHVLLAAARLPGDVIAFGQSVIKPDVDIVLHSFAECLVFVNAHRP